MLTTVEQYGLENDDEIMENNRPVFKNVLLFSKILHSDYVTGDEKGGIVPG